MNAADDEAAPRRSEDHLRATHLAYVLHGRVARARPGGAGWKMRALLATDPSYASLEEGVRTAISRVLARAASAGLEDRVLELVKSEGFQVCSQQHAVLDVLLRAPLSLGLIDDLQRISHALGARSPAEAPAAVVAKFFWELGRIAGDEGARALFLELARTPGFAVLEAQDAIVLLRCAAGPLAGSHAPRARQNFLDAAWRDRRAELADRLRDPEYREAAPHEQAEMLLDHINTPHRAAYFLHAMTFRGRALIMLGDPKDQPSLSWSRAARRIVGRETAAKIESPAYAIGAPCYAFKRIDLTRLEELLFVEWIESNHTINPSENVRLLPTRQRLFEPAYAFALRLAERRGAGVAEEGTLARGQRVERSTNLAAANLAPFDANLFHHLLAHAGRPGTWAPGHPDRQAGHPTAEQHHAAPLGPRPANRSSQR